MEAQNKSHGTGFVLLGLSSLLSHEIHLFLVFVADYLVTVASNFMIIIVILLDSRLHTPMYFFLSQLSCLDICLSSVVVPKILVNFLHQQYTISYVQCLAQAFFVIGFAGCEPALLAVMAYDRYAAICQPLHYAHLMRGKVCIQMSMAVWIWGFLDSAIYAALASRLEFCGNNYIPHMYCDVPPLLKIACSDTSVPKTVSYINSTLVGLVPVLLIILSYVYILSSILQIRSEIGRRKAFSTCASHLAVVTLFVGNAFVNYNQPSAGYSLEVDTFISTMFCIVTPMLNPLIYTLRNKEVKGALKKLLHI
ncbi:olfactory receptor 5V1-like [Erythrolamprus reginae]|uniref:olfactory receptor 5V1-like n=1 Tax=Erythrolamprus reginae TaxID=121349 RepID=UPI00396C63B5